MSQSELLKKVVAVLDASNTPYMLTGSDESGTWQPASGGPLNFSNLYRWSRVADSLRLEHLRFGADRPVFLFDMIEGDDGDWRERSPHVCGEDRYAASLAVRENELHVAWSIHGPRKRESIRYFYR